MESPEADEDQDDEGQDQREHDLPVQGPQRGIKLPVQPADQQPEVLDSGSRAERDGLEGQPPRRARVRFAVDNHAEREGE